ncbi:MAG: MBL fold metallo-hydrolase [Candidatus Shapirobacteria bacterium]|nr:MBL fold metallo-hydrolase [Candidatus Shapirobacteria bacterium]
MKSIQFLGAAGGVTGSSFLLSGSNDDKILIDLGLFQGVDDSQNFNFAPFLFDPIKLKAVLLTHAHLDHCGRLPLLIKNGFKGKIYATEPTKMITYISLLDSAKIAQEEEREILFTKEEAEETCRQIEIVNYDILFTTGEFNIIFRNAGHILGSASIEIFSKDSKSQTIVFSGDLGNYSQDLIKPPEYIAQADVVVMESTYGNTFHPKEDVLAILQEEINIIENTNGVLVIPAFSIERTQEILDKIDHLKGKRMIKNFTPVYLDSPMSIKVTEIFKKYPRLYSSELSGEITPFDFPNLICTKTTEESKAILKTDNPKIIIAGSGMMVGGRVLHHLKNYLSLPTTRVLIVGYQAVGTLGREIEEGAKTVTIYGQKINIKATVRKIEALSSHADQPKLLQWLKHIQGVKKVFLVHGENEQRIALAERIKKDLEIKDVVLPLKDQVYLADKIS